MGHVLAFFGIPFAIPLLVPAGFLVGGAIAGSRLDNSWPGSVPRLAGSFVTGGILSLLSIPNWPGGRVRIMSDLVFFCAAWFAVVFALAAVVATWGSQDKSMPVRLALKSYAAGGVVGAALAILLTRMSETPPYVAVPLAIICAFATIGGLIAGSPGADHERVELGCVIRWRLTRGCTPSQINTPESSPRSGDGDGSRARPESSQRSREERAAAAERGQAGLKHP